LGGETFTDENQPGMFIKILQLARRIHEQTFDAARRKNLFGGDFAAVDKFDSPGLKIAPRFLASFKMTGHQYKEQIGEMFSQAEKLIRQLLLPGVSAASHQNAGAILAPSCRSNAGTSVKRRSSS
jgi:hypothetical protein